MKIALNHDPKPADQTKAGKNTGLFQMKIHREIWHVYKLIILLLAFLIIMSRVMPHSHDGWWNGEYNCLSKGWTCVRDSGKITHVTLPEFISVPAGEKITLQGRLPEKVSDGSTLFIYCMRQDMVAYINGQRVATYKGSASDMPYKWYTVQCDSSESGGSLRISYESKYDDFAGCLNNIYLGERSTIIYHLAVKNMFPLIAGVIICIAGIVILIYYGLFIRTRDERRFLYMSAYMLVMGLWLIMECRVNQTFLSNLAYAQKIDYIGLILLPVPVILYVNEIEDGEFSRTSMTLATVATVFMYVCLLGSAAGGIDLCRVVPYAHAFIAISVIYVLATMFILLRRKEKKYDRIKWNFYGMIALCIGAATDLYGYYFRRNEANDTGIAVGITIYCICGFCQFVMYQRERQLEEADAFKQNSDRTKFLADMSHAIRTPANAVLGMDNMILRESNNVKISEYATDIKSAGNTLLSSIDDILDFSNIEAGKIELKKEKYSIASLLNDCYNLIIMRAQAKGLNFVVDNDPDIPSELYGDVTRIRQIIINMLTNAVKYTSKGNVILSVDKIEIAEKDCIILQIDVMDTGIGISREEQKKLFSPYARLDESKNKEIEGTGLGLALTKRLVNLMEGSISVESIYGAGSKFTVRIKQKISDRSPAGNFSDWVKHRDEKTQIVKWFYVPDVRILVVDDVAMNIKVMRGLLGETGVIIDEAESGQECLQMTAERKYDMIFMDDMMPEMSGTETYIKMKNDSRNHNSDTPVIMLTANAVMGAREAYLGVGFSGYLVKPIIESELKAIMEKYLPPELVLPAEEDDHDSEEGEIADKEEIIVHDSTEEAHDEKNNRIIKEMSMFINTEEGMRYCMDKPDFYIDILRDYTGMERRDMIVDTYGSQDWKNYRINVHALKSTSRMIGADSLSEKALKLEEAARDLNIEYIQQNHGEMMEEYDGLLEKMKAVLER